MWGAKEVEYKFDPGTSKGSSQIVERLCFCLRKKVTVLLKNIDSLRSGLRIYDSGL